MDDAPRAGPTTTRPPRSPPRARGCSPSSAILVGGLCGGLIGYGFTDLQCGGRLHRASPAASGLLGAVLGAVGVGVVVVLALRAMGEWRTRPEPRRPLLR